MYQGRFSNSLKALVLVIFISAFGCKSSKKAAEARRIAAEKTRTEQEARQKQQDEDKRKQAAADEAARQNAVQRRNAATSTPSVKLGQYFEAIAGASNVASANGSINEALGMFASGDTPVLIVISGSGDQKDYDRPTTIRLYLNYLKDQKKNINKIENLDIDSSGKITSVELRKN